MDIQYTDNPDRIDFERLAILLNRSGSTEFKELNSVIKAFTASAYSVFALADDNVVGACRALSDNIEWTLLTDLAILPEYDANIIGGAIVDMFTERFKGHEIFAYTDSRYYAVFEDHGFFRSKNSFTYSGYDGDIGITRLSEKSFLPLGFKFENEFEAPIMGFPYHTKSKTTSGSVIIRYTDSLDGVDFKDINDLLSNAFGGRKRELSVTKKSFTGSRYVQFAFDNEKLIGCARAQSDGISQGFILNVAVDPSYQGHHLGREVVSRLSSQMKGQNIFLNTHPGSVGFYNQKGFRRNKNAFLFPAHPDMLPEARRGFMLPKGYRFPDEYCRTD